MDTKTSIDDYKKEWFNQVEQDSKNLFLIAEDAIKKRPDLKIVIIKRVPRFDRSTKDIIGIKSKLSNYANTVLDQLWIKSGSPSNILIVELQLNIEKSRYLRDLLYGEKSKEINDGIHLRGPGASRHFTYRATQAVKPVLGPVSAGQFPRILRTGNYPSRQTVYVSPAKPVRNNDHKDCPQTQFQQRQGRSVSYAETVRGKHGKQGNVYNVSTSNMWEHLNC